MAPVLSPVLRVFSGGAAQGLCEALGPVFESTQACRIDGHFGAVGGMRDRLRAGEPCDVVILTQALVAALAEQGLVVAADAVPVGMVATGVAVAEGAAGDGPDTTTAERLRATLLQTRVLHCPDTEKSTAGQHVMGMLRAMGIADTIEPRIVRYPGGNLAMAELARRGRAGQADGEIGITQVTEIRYTPGVRLAGLLPAPHALDTVYVAAPCTHTREPERARAWIAELTAERHSDIRTRCGFA